MKRSLILTLFFVPLFLSACLGENRAPVTVYGGKPGAGSAGTHFVLEGDTLWSISKRYKMEMQDIAYANNLRPPFKLNEGQRLRMPPPREYVVRAGDTLFKVSRLFNTSTAQIARLNDLSSPYILRTGQALKLPSPRASVNETRVAKAVKRVQSRMPTPDTKPSNIVTPGQKPTQGQKRVQAAKKGPVSTRPPKRSSSKFMKPVSGKTISGFGPKKNGLHNDGINISAPRGAPVRSAENGVVVYAGSELKGSGNLVLVRHEGRYMTAYAHMDRILIKRGQTVTRGQTIGTVGSTGAVSSPQLHFEVRKGTKAVNPKSYLAK